MKHKSALLIDSLCFVTIWIFARMKPLSTAPTLQFRFVTIWIFARMKLHKLESGQRTRFVTIWIFARMKPKERQVK